jgi:hypothetical protein
MSGSGLFPVMLLWFGHGEPPNDPQIHAINTLAPQVPGLATIGIFLSARKIAVRYLDDIQGR